VGKQKDVCPLYVMISCSVSSFVPNCALHPTRTGKLFRLFGRLLGARSGELPRSAHGVSPMAAIDKIIEDSYAYLKGKWWGLPLVGVGFAAVIAFSVWNSLPNSVKERLLSPSQPTPQVPAQPTAQPPTSTTTNADELLRTLHNANIRNSVGDSTMLEWLRDSDQRYRRLAEECLRQVGKKHVAKEGVDLDKVNHYYVESLGVKTDGNIPIDHQIDSQQLVRAIIKSYNNKN
jgi:hypothetical protein